jgi:cystathionine beta-synthase
MILADPEGSILADYVNKGELGNDVGSWLVEGIGEDFIPPVSDLSLVTSAYAVTDAEAFETARTLLAKAGILAGSSTGTLIAAALHYCRDQDQPKRVVTLVCDSGNKYLSKMFNDYWMSDQGFFKRPSRGDLSDLISRQHSEHATVTVSPDETLSAAFGRMALFDISQLPVLKADKIVGIIDESDILLRVVENEDRFSDTVETAMTARLQTLPTSANVTDLLPIFEEGRTAIVVDGERFLGLITPTDLLNYLRQKRR